MIGRKDAMNKNLTIYVFAFLFVLIGITHPSSIFMLYIGMGIFTWIVFISAYYVEKSIGTLKARFFGLPIVLLWLPMILFPHAVNKFIWK